MNQHAVARVDVVGSIATDTILQVAGLPIAGEQVEAAHVVHGLGGRGANQAVAVARCGLDARLVGAIGDDEAGRSALETLAAYGVDTELVSVHPGSETGHGYVVSEPTGLSRKVTVHGANSHTDTEAVHDVGDRLANSAVVIAQSEIGEGALAELITMSESWPGRLVVHMAPTLVLDPDLLARIDVLVVNETGAALLCDCPASTELGDVEDMAVELASRGRSVVVTRGPEGAVVVPSRRPVEFVMAARAKVVDPAGAGDAFVGVLAAGLASGFGVQEATAAAVRQATRTVARAGGASSYPMFVFH